MAKIIIVIILSDAGIKHDYSPIRFIETQRWNENIIELKSSN